MLRPRRWHPTNKNDLEGLLFEGAPKLLGKLDKLVLRPRLWWRETLLPIIYLVCAVNSRNPLDGLASRLHQARGVLFSRINGQDVPAADNGQPARSAVRRLLDGVVADLSQRGEHRRRRPLKFPHYSLAVWLTSLATNDAVPGHADDPGRRINEALKEFMKERFWLLRNRTTRAEVSLLDEIPRWVRTPVMLLPPAGMVLMRMFWRPPRWVARSRIAAVHSSGSFRGLARKFVAQGSGEHQHGVGADELDRLLVDAFMEDLRRAYRRRGGALLGLRRRTYPVLLVDRVAADTPGLALLRLISDSRTGYLRESTSGPRRQATERSYFHPLLIIAQGDDSALGAMGLGTMGLGAMGLAEHQSAEHDSLAVADIDFYYREWYRALADSDRTWFLPLRVPSTHPAPGYRAQVTELPLPTARKPVLVFVLAVLLVVPMSMASYGTANQHCGSWDWTRLQRQPLDDPRSQCIGLGSDQHRFFANLTREVPGIDETLAKDLAEIENTIYENNRRVVTREGYLTVVYLSQLSSVSATDYRAELAQLQGIKTVQEKNLDKRPVQVLLANAGYQMKYGRQAAEAIVRAAAADPTLMAVLGMGISREETGEAIEHLSNNGIPMIATTISATDLATSTSSYYHQVGPTNRREAEVGAYYAEHILFPDTGSDAPREVVIYYPDSPTDLYSQDLKEQAMTAFTAPGFAVRAQPYPLSPHHDDGPRNAGKAACQLGPDGLVFFAGRGGVTQLGSFLDGMRSVCGTNYPHFLGGDSVARFVLDGGLRDYGLLTVDYLALASSLAWGADCPTLFGAEVCEHGGALMAHDAFEVFMEGVRRAPRKPSPESGERPTRDGVLRGIEQISGRDTGLGGASGWIEYSNAEEPAIPANKTILVIRVRGGQEPNPELVLRCGHLEQPRTADSARTTMCEPPPPPPPPPS